MQITDFAMSFNSMYYVLSKFCALGFASFSFFAVLVKWLRETVKNNELETAGRNTDIYNILNLGACCGTEFIVLTEIYRDPYYQMELYVPLFAMVVVNLAMEVVRKISNDGLSVVDIVCYVLSVVLTLVLTYVVALIQPSIAPFFNIPLIGVVLFTWFVKILTVCTVKLIDLLLVKREYQHVIDTLTEELADELKNIIYGDLCAALHTLFPDYDFRHGY